MRERLRFRLTRRGFQASGIVLTSRPPILATSAVRSGLLRSTVQAAMSVSVGGVVNSGLISGNGHYTERKDMQDHDTNQANFGCDDFGPRPHSWPVRWW